MRGGRTLLTLVVLTALAGCDAPRGLPQAEPQPSPIGWRDGALPDPGEGTTATVRDLVRCGDGWLAVGAVRLGADPNAAPNDQPPATFRPAAWRWDGAWHELKFSASTLYGERAVLRSAACRGGEIVAVGAASGGFHGSARVTTWHGDTTTLTENYNNDFELFGGLQAAGVGEVAAGGPGFVIVGNWVDGQGRPGPTVWLSADGRKWVRQADNPTLVSSAEQARFATGLAADPDAAAGSGALVLVGEEHTGLRITPLMLRSTDGVTWRRVPMVGEGGLRRLAGQGADLLGLGVRPGEVTVWRADDPSDGWRADGSFPLDQGTRPAEVGGAVRLGDSTLVAACGGATCGVWQKHLSGTAWARLTLPATLDARADSTVRLVTAAGRVAVLLDDGTRARIFIG